MFKTLCICISAPVLFASCGAVDTMKSATASATRSVKSATASATKKVTQSIDDFRSPDVDVVEVREKDLKEMPLGKDRALAYEKKAKTKRTFWSYVTPNSYIEPIDLPTLPDMDEGDMDSSLLPPKS